MNEDGTITRRSGRNTPINPTSTATSSRQSVGTSSSIHTDGVPEEIKKWNWGAFFFYWLWGICNGVYWPLILIVVNFIPYVGPLITLGGCIALGINGNEWAWKAKSWSSVTEFKRVQHKWAIAILWVLGISLVVGFLGGVIAGGM